jgi:DNA-binding CsgD family transcriptional regulator
MPAEAVGIPTGYGRTRPAPSWLRVASHGERIKSLGIPMAVRALRLGGAATWPLDGAAARAATAISEIMEEPVPITQRARRILQVLDPVFGYDAASIALRDPERQIRIPLASVGDAAALQAYWSGAEADAELARLRLDRPGPPILSTELSTVAAESAYWRRCLAPAGFRGAIDAALFTDDGRHVGHLSLLSRADGRPTLADRDLAGALAPLIARAVDRLPAVRLMAGIVADVFAGTVLTRGGNTLPLPGLPVDPVLAAGSAAIAEVVDRLGAGDRYATFLHPALDTGTGALLRVTALDCSDDVADHLRAAVLLSHERDLHGLSRHDLQVLGLIAAGWEDNHRIAAALNCTPDDVAETTRRGMQLLGSPSRTGLAVRTLREGLFFPPRASGRR